MIKEQPYTKGDIIIGNDAWMGHEVTIISGVKISACGYWSKSRRYQERGDIRDYGG